MTNSNHDFSNLDLTGFFYPEECYNVDAKELKYQAEKVFRAFEGWVLLEIENSSVPSWVPSGLPWCFPDYITSCNKNTIKKMIKGIQGSYSRTEAGAAELTQEEIDCVVVVFGSGIEKFAELNSQWKENKGRLIKGRKPNENAKPVIVVDDPIIRESLEVLAEPTKNHIASGWLASASFEITGVLAQADGRDIDSKLATSLAFSESDMKLAADESRDTGDWDSYKSMSKENERLHGVVRGYFTYEQEEGGHRILRDWKWIPQSEDVLKQRASKHANDVWCVFLGKMEQKLGGLGLTSIVHVDQDYSGIIETWDCTMICEARNGVKFTLNNRIIFKISQRGTFFQQYPARFSSVMQNGEEVKNAASLESVRSLCDFNA